MFKFFKNWKNMALIDAAKEGDLNKVRKLLDKGANVDTKDKYGHTPVILASMKNYPEIVKVLLEAGVDINAKNKVGCLGIHSDGGKTVAWGS